MQGQSPSPTLMLHGPVYIQVRRICKRSDIRVIIRTVYTCTIASNLQRWKTRLLPLGSSPCIVVYKSTGHTDIYLNAGRDIGKISYFWVYLEANHPIQWIGTHLVDRASRHKELYTVAPCEAGTAHLGSDQWWQYQQGLCSGSLKLLGSGMLEATLYEPGVSGSGAMYKYKHNLNGITGSIAAQWGVPLSASLNIFRWLCG